MSNAKKAGITLYVIAMFILWAGMAYSQTPIQCIGREIVPIEVINFYDEGCGSIGATIKISIDKGETWTSYLIVKDGTILLDIPGPDGLYEIWYVFCDRLGTCISEDNKKVFQFARDTTPPTDKGSIRLVTE